MASGRIVLDSEMMENAKRHCNTYLEMFKTERTALENAMEALWDGFQGEAADGFKVFYEERVLPVMQTTVEQYLNMFAAENDGLFDVIKNTLVVGEGVDPTLGSNNKNVGQ